MSSHQSLNSTSKKIYNLGHRASAFANYRMPAPPFQNGPSNPGLPPGRLPFFNDAFFRSPRKKTNF